MTSLKYLALFAVGGMGHKCYQVELLPGGVAEHGLFVDNPLCAWAGHSLEGT